MQLARDAYELVGHYLRENVLLSLGQFEAACQDGERVVALVGWIFSPPRKFLQSFHGLGEWQSRSGATVRQDAVCALGPLERRRVFVPCVEELLDGPLQLFYAVVRAALDLVGRQDAEPAFHLIEPRGVGGDEVEMESRVVGQPPLDSRGAVRGVVVDDDVNVEV